MLRRVFDHAVRDGAIHRNPAVGIRLPKVQGNDLRPLTHDELWRLADYLAMSPVKDHQARTVPIPAIVSDELSTFGATAKPDALVFPSSRNTPLRNRNFRRDVFDDAVDALDLNITPHNLRDTAASLAIQAGASVIAVARLLGHESAATTLNHYAGLFPSDLDDVAHRLDAAARQTIEKQSQSSGATEAPTKHRPEGSEEP